MPNTTNVWSAAEVEATVDAYADLFTRHASGENVNKNTAYQDLVRAHGRSTSAYQYRFRNISHVLTAMGLPLLPGVQPAEHVGPTATATIRRVIEEKGYFRSGLAAPTADLVVLERRTSALLNRGMLRKPLGAARPVREAVLLEQYVRDPAVKAWVLAQANGRCECCGQMAPFVREDGTPFLEVHHVKWLSEGGSDTVGNAAAICPNCHRRFHYGTDLPALVDQLYAKVTRLQREP